MQLQRPSSAGHHQSGGAAILAGAGRRLNGVAAQRLGNLNKLAQLFALLSAQGAGCPGEIAQHLEIGKARSLPGSDLSQCRRAALARLDILAPDLHLIETGVMRRLELLAGFTV